MKQLKVRGPIEVKPVPDVHKVLERMREAEKLKTAYIR